MNTLLAMNFNKTEFLQLLKNKRKIKGKEKSKYYKYRAFIGVQFYCQYGERFLIILENYVNKKIELDILLDDFSEYKKMITKITDEFLEQVVEKPTLLDSFQIYSNAKEFYRQVENIEALDEDLFDNLCLDNPPYDFDTVVKKTYYTMKRLMEESKSTFLPTDEQIVNDSLLVSAEKFENQNVYTLCPQNRFTNLVMEDTKKKPNVGGVREAITVLQAEMEGHFYESSRLDLGVKGKNKYQIQGADYKAIDQNGNLIAIELKNLVYNKSVNPSETPFENGRKMGATAYKQQHAWVQTNADKLTKKYGNSIKIENLPKQPSDFVLVFDLFDVDQNAKKEVIAGIKEGAKTQNKL